MLDAVEGQDEVERVPGLGRGGLRVEEFAAHVRPARHARAALGQGDAVVTRVAVDERVAARAAQDGLGRRTAATGTVHVGDEALGPEGPDVSPARLALIEHALRRLVRAHQGGLAHQGEQSRRQRRGGSCNGMKEVTQRRARNRGTRACERLRLAVEGNRVAHLRSHQVGQQPGAVVALLEGLGRHGRDNALPTPAYERLLHVHLSLEARRDVLEDARPLAGAQAPEVRAATRRAATLGGRDPMVDDALGKVGARLAPLLAQLQRRGPRPGAVT